MRPWAPDWRERAAQSLPADQLDTAWLTAGELARLDFNAKLAKYTTVAEGAAAPQMSAG